MSYVNNIKNFKLQIGNMTMKKYTNIIIAMLINVAALFIGVFLFTPSPKSDDTMQTFYLLGSMSGQYSPLPIFSSLILGKLIYFLNISFPGISWYYIVLNFIIFVSLTFIDFTILDWSAIRTARTAPASVFACLLFSMFCSYEFYTRFTFSKVAGLAVIAGFLIIQYTMDKSSGKYLRGILLGCVLIFIGVLVRPHIYEVAVLCAFVPLFIIYLIRNWRSVNIKRILIYIAVVSVFFGSTYIVNFIDRTAMSNDAYWSAYVQNHPAHGQLYDYPWPDYNTYEAEYEKYGVSYSDFLYMSESRFYGDNLFYTMELSDNIRSIANGDGITSVTGKIQTSLFDFIPHYKNETATWCLLGAVCFFVLTLQYRKTQIKQIAIQFIPVAIIGAILITSYFYMLIIGRTRHHIDTVVLVGLSAVLLYLSEVKNLDHKVKSILVTVIPLLITVEFYMNFKGEIQGDNYYGRDYHYIRSGGYTNPKYTGDDQAIVDFISEDKTHLYIVPYKDYIYIYNRVDHEKPIWQPGILDNMYMPQGFNNPVTIYVKEKYNVDNPIVSLPDSDLIRMAVLDCNANTLDATSVYLNNHYVSNTEYTEVDRIGDLGIYQFHETNPIVEWNDYDITPLKRTDVKIYKEPLFKVTGEKASITGNMSINNVSYKKVFASYKDSLNEEIFYHMQLSNTDKRIFTGVMNLPEQHDLESAEVTLFFVQEPYVFTWNITKTNWVIQ